VGVQAFHKRELTFNKKHKMSVWYSENGVRCTVSATKQWCVINMIDVINGENVIYACGHPAHEQSPMESMGMRKENPSTFQCPDHR